MMMSRDSRLPERPLFTIAIPTFNRAQWLRDCIVAALAQEFGSFEVIVSDNASSDETADVLTQFSDRRLIVIRQPRNLGPIGNWNACLEAANGVYIVILSDDDTVTTSLLERCGALIGTEDNIPVVVALGDVFEPQTGIRRTAVASRLLKSGVCDGTEILLEFLAGRISPQMCTVAMKTERLRTRGGFPDDWPHAGDLVSWVPMLLEGRAGFVNESCGTYRSHDATQTAKFSVETRLKDIERLAHVIVEEANQKVSDPLILLEIKKRARRYVARNCIGHIGMDRKNGASRRKIVVMAWKWRQQIAAGIFDVATLARPLTLFLLPLSMTKFVSGLKRRFNTGFQRSL